MTATILIVGKILVAVGPAIAAFQPVWDEHKRNRR